MVVKIQNMVVQIQNTRLDPKSRAWEFANMIPMRAHIITLSSLYYRVSKDSPSQPPRHIWPSR